MKRQFLKFIPLMIGVVMGLSSCSDDDSTDDPASNPLTPKPTVGISVNGTAGQSDYSMMQGSSIMMTITANSAAGGGAKLDKIRLEQNGVNATSASTAFDLVSSNTNTYSFMTNADQDIKNADNETIALTGAFAGITANVGTTTYTFTVTDKDGVSNTATFDITVFSSTAFTITDVGTIYHIAGANRGSYSLSGDSTVSSADASAMADISNTDMAATAFTGSFKVGDTRATTDLVVADAAFDYANATQETAKTAYDAGTKVTSVTNPSANDVYVYSLTNGDMVVVQVTAVEPTNDDCSCTNKGKMTFGYKK